MVVSSLTDLRGVFRSLIERQRAFQRRTLDVLHYEVVRADIIQSADIRVIHCGDGAGFALESLSELFRRNLDGYIAAEACITSLPDLAHAAFANGREDLLRNYIPGGQVP